MNSKMKLKLVSEMLAEVSKATSKKKKGDLLRAYGAKFPAVMSALYGIYDPRVKWMLPEGPVPYTPQDITDDGGGIHREFRKFYVFTNSKASANLPNMKREALYIEMLESLPAKDAELLVAMKDKTMPYKGISQSLVKEVFPEIFGE